MSRGINAFKYKLLSSLLSSFFVGVTGGAWAWYMTYIEPTGAYNIMVTVNMIIMTLFGGIGSIIGPIIGAATFTFIMELLNIYMPWTYPVLAGIIILVLIRFAPGGIYSLIEKVTRR
jgi:branched-chain amino acid transport system permease protein